MISFGRLSCGHAEEFEEAVAASVEDYDAGRGEAPGVWKGSGAAVLGLDGRVLDGQLVALFEMRDPLTGEPLGNIGYTTAKTFLDRGGVERHRDKRPGFDATFSVPKSVSLLFAYGDDAIRGEVVGACEVAVDAAIEHLEAHAAFSRAGKGGVRQVDTDGLVVGQFMRRMSRAGDPQLHFHLIVSNRVRCVNDGTWRALDGRPLHAELKTAGMIGQAVLRCELRSRLGVAWEPVSIHGQAEILGVPKPLMALLSKRTVAVEAHAAVTIAEAEAAVGRGLTAAERAEKFSAAAVITRGAKFGIGVPGEGLLARWLMEATEAGYDPDDWLMAALDRDQVVMGEDRSDEALIVTVLTELTDTKSTWKRSDVTRALARLITSHAADGDDCGGPVLATRIAALTDTALSESNVVEVTPVTAGAQGHTRATDGRPETELHHRRAFTTVERLRRDQVAEAPNGILNQGV